MSASDDEQPDGKSDDDKTDSTTPAGNSLFDSPWSAELGKPKGPAFTPPPSSSFALPKVNKPPDTTPRTSEANTAVSGEFGDSDTTPANADETGDAKTDGTTSETQADDAKTDDAKTEPKSDDETKAETKTETTPTAEPDEAKADDAKTETDVKTDDAKADAKAETKAKAKAKSDDVKTDDAKTKTKTDAGPETAKTKTKSAAPKPAEPEPASGGSPSVLLILGVVAAILAAIWYVGSGASRDEAGQGPSKPNTARSDNNPKPAAKPAPRSKITQHTPDPNRTKQPSQAPVEPPPEPTDDSAEIEPVPVDTGEPPSPDPDIEPPPVEPPPSQPKIAVENPRDPSLIPSGTPAENAKAFSKLPVAPSDGPPIGGIGRSGIHVDDVAMGEGRDNTSCDQPTRSFSTGTEFVNVCFRVIHPRASETLRVYWEKDGTVTRRGKVRIPENLHAYKTRAYLQVRPEYVGKWRVRIVPEDEDNIDLAVAEFEISN